MGSRMKSLEPPDSLHLKAAQGWLELGNHIEADAELDEIAPALRIHPDVLEVRWQIYATARKWEACADIAATITRLAPDEPLGWIYRSFALHELKRTQEARDNLLPVVEAFPHEALMRYNLACYECQLGCLQQAKEWLQKAFETSREPTQLRLMALEDPDLEPLWRGIGSL